MNRQTSPRTQCAAASTAGMLRMAINITTFLLPLLMVISIQANASATSVQNVCDSVNQQAGLQQRAKLVCSPGPCPNDASFDARLTVADIPELQQPCATDKAGVFHIVTFTTAAADTKTCAESCLKAIAASGAMPGSTGEAPGSSDTTPGSASATPGTAGVASPRVNTAHSPCFAVAVATCLLMAMGLLP